MVERFNAEVWVTRGGETVGGTSIMGLMMLSAGPGTIDRRLRGRPRGQAALDAISELVAGKFNEEICDVSRARCSVQRCSEPGPRTRIERTMRVESREPMRCHPERLDGA